MKKRTKTLFALLTAFCLSAGLGIFAACGDPNTPPEDHTQHVDANEDGKCDECGADMGGTVTPPATAHTVTFSTDGGSEVPPQAVDDGGKATEPPAAPTKPGHVFAGWYKNAACTEEFDFNTGISADTTIYAKWEKAAETEDTYFRYTQEGEGWSLAVKTGETVPADTVIPAEIEGKAVTSIAETAFEGQTQLVSVTIPSSVKKIGSRAFRNCTALENVLGGENVEEMGANTFYGTKWDSNLAVGEVYFGKTLYKYAGALYTDTEITVKDGTVGIAAGAFQNMSKVTGVTLPAGLTNIGSYAFGSSDAAKGNGITTLVLPESVVTVAENAFRNAKSLATLTIGKNVTKIGANAFAGTAITTLNYNAANAEIANNMFSGFTAEATLTVGDDVEVLPANLTKGWTGIKTVTLGAKITEIPASAFDGITKLSQVNFDTITSIGSYAFRNTSLESFTIPSTVTRLGGGAFADCTKLASLTYDAVDAAGTTSTAVAFSGCTALTKVTVGADVTAIPAYLLLNVASVNTIELGGKVETIGEQAFSGTGITAITLPNSLLSIGGNAFVGTKLQTLTIPENVTTVGAGAFKDITTLTALTFNAISMGDFITSPFSGCTELSTVTFGSTVAQIPAYLFAGNTKISKIVFPATCKTVGAHAFDGCTALETVEGIENVTSLGTDALNQTPYMENILNADGPVYVGSILMKYNGDIPENYTLELKEGTKAIADNAFDTATAGTKKNLVAVTWGNTLETIGANAFSNSGLTSVILPSSVRKVGDRAFQSCSSLANITLTDGIEEIGEYAFANCKNSSITIPKTVTTVGDHAFDGTQVKTIIIQAPLTEVGAWFTSVNPKVIELPDTVTKLTGGWTLGLSLETFNAKGVKEIYGTALYGLPSLEFFDFRQLEVIGEGALMGYRQTALTLGPNIRSIAEAPFGHLDRSKDPSEWYSSGAVELTQITIQTPLEELPNWFACGLSKLNRINLKTPVKKIGNYAFSNTSLGGTFDFSEVTEIGDYAFEGVSLTNVSLPKIERLGKAAFNKSRLTTLTLGDKLTSISNGAFSYTAIKSVTLPSSVKSIGEAAFGDSQVTYLDLGEVTSIGGFAFRGCPIAEVTLPDGLTTIGERALSSAKRVFIGDNSKLSTFTLGGADSSFSTSVEFVCTDSALTRCLEAGGAWQLACVDGTWDTVWKTRFFKQSWIKENGWWIDEEGTAYHYEGGETSLEVPAEVKTLKVGAVPTTVTEITVNAQNTAMKAEENILFSLDGKTLILYLPSLAGEEYTIPEAVTAIADGAFATVVNLKSVTVTAEEPFTCGANAFDGVKDIFVPAGTGETYRATAGWDAYKSKIKEEGQTDEWTIDEKGKLTAWLGSGTEVTIPVEFNGVTVTSVDVNAFRNNPAAGNITKLTILGKVTFGRNVIQKTYALDPLKSCTEVVYSYTGTGSSTSLQELPACQKITVTEGVVEIPASFISTGLQDTVTEISLPDGLLNIKGGFSNLKKVTTINIPDSVTTIAANTFKGSSGLTSIELPKSLTSIGSDAFTNCTSLAEVTFRGTSLTTLPQSLFQNTALVNVVLPEGVTTVTRLLFKGCTKIETVVFPSTVTSITGEDIIPAATKSITFKAPQVVSVPISSYLSVLPESCKIYVPADMVDSYKESQTFSSYADRIEQIPATVSMEIPEALLPGKND